MAEIRKRLGLDQPILTQFVIWIGKTLQGDLGESFFFKKQVAELILDRLEPTLSLAFFTHRACRHRSPSRWACWPPIGTAAGSTASSWASRCSGFSVPVFVIGYVLIYVFAIELNWLPVQGYQRLAPGRWRLAAAAHPAPRSRLSVIYVALIARITRTSVLEVMNEDYIRTARAKGQTEGKVLIRHALANAAVPIVTVIGLGVALLIGGVVVTEIGLHDPGPRPADGRCRARARLSDHPGRHPAVLARLRAHQPGRRHDLYVLRSEDPLLSIEALPAELAE